MAELPTVQWEVKDYLEWMKPGFDYLQFQWVEQDEEDPPPWETVCRADFLKAMETDENQLEAEPRLRVLNLFIYHADEGFTDEAERREILLDPSQQEVILQTCIDTWRQEEEAAIPPAPPPPGSLESLTWLPRATKDQLSAGLGEAWVPPLRDFLDEHYDGWTGASQDQVGEFITGWMGEILGTIPVAPPQPGSLQSLTWLPKQQKDQLSAGLGDDWTAQLHDFLDEHYDGWTGASQDQVGEFITGWMGEILGTIPVAPPPPQEETPNQIARQALDDLAAKVTEDREDLAGQADPEELQQLLAELLQEGLTARAG